MPSDDHQANGAAMDAARVGAALRAARLRLGWALPDVAAMLRIRLEFLQAIEDGRVAGLPGSAYAVGFLRSYAAALGLDAGEVARRFRAEAHQVNRKTKLAFPVPMPDRGVPPGAVVLLGVLLMLGAYAGWFRFADGAPPLAEAVAVVPERLAPLADRAAPPSSPVPQVASVLPGSPTSAFAAPAPVLPPPAAPPADIAPAPPARPLTTDGRITLRARAEAWVQVRERQGPVLLSRVMRAGDSWPVPNGTRLLLSTGNAGGTELLVDGLATPALGNAGAVRRDVPLDPDALKAISTGPPPAQ